MPIFKYLHIITMFMAVSFSVGPEILLHRIARTREVCTIRNAFRVGQPLGIAVPILFVIGLLFGLTAAFTGGFDFFAPWLILAYIIFAIAFIVSAAITGPWQEKVGMAAAASPDDKPSAELAALIDAKTAQYATWTLAIAIIAIVFVMVTKPGGIQPLFK